MLPHGRTHLERLAASCIVRTTSHHSGRRITVASFDTACVTQLRDAYNAVLMADLEDSILDLIEEQGVPLRGLLTHGARDEVTRSDATELASAAVLMRVDSWDPDRMHMPNVPKRSRAKSDSGLDILELRLSDHAAALDALADDELLRIASVKHTTLTTTSDCVSKLKSSLGERELSTAYLAVQLRPVHGGLLNDGYTREAANRVFLFARELATREHLQLTGIAVVDSAAAADAEPRIGAALDTEGHWHSAAIVSIPNIAQLHQECV